MKKKEKPRVTAADLVNLAKQVEDIHDRAIVNMQSVTVDLQEMQGPLVIAVGKLTLLEATGKPVSPWRKKPR